MTIGQQYFWSMWYTSAQAMTPSHGSSVSGLKSMTRPHFISINAMLFILLHQLHSLYHIHSSVMDNEIRLSLYPEILWRDPQSDLPIIYWSQISKGSINCSGLLFYILATSQSYRDGHQLEVVHASVDFIMLSSVRWGCQHHALISHSPTLSCHWANQSLPYPNNAGSLARKRQV